MRHGAASLPQQANSATERPSTVVGIALLIWHPSPSDSSSTRKARRRSSGHYFSRRIYAAFFPAALNFAHLFRCAAAIFLRAEIDKVRFAGADAVVFATTAGCDPFRAFAHRAFCACAIFRREAADTIRAGGPNLRDTPEPFNDSITKIA